MPWTRYKWTTGTTQWLPRDKAANRRRQETWWRTAIQETWVQINGFRWHVTGPVGSLRERPWFHIGQLGTGWEICQWIIKRLAGCHQLAQSSSIRRLLATHKGNRCTLQKNWASLVLKGVTHSGCKRVKFDGMHRKKGLHDCTGAPRSPLWGVETSLYTITRYRVVIPS